MRKILWKDHPFLWSISKVRINYYSLTKIWCLEFFYSETTTLQIFLKNCWETRFHCLFSLNEKIIAMCHLIIRIKCVAIIRFKENWSSLKESFWNNGPSNMLSLCFIDFLLLVFFTAFLPKTLWKNRHFLI